MHRQFSARLLFPGIFFMKSIQNTDLKLSPEPEKDTQAGFSVFHIFSSLDILMVSHNIVV